MSKLDWFRYFMVGALYGCAWLFGNNFLRGAFIGFGIMGIVLKLEEKKGKL